MLPPQTLKAIGVCMYRIRISLPPRESKPYQNLDLIHDALVNALSKAGASSQELVGEHAALWNFAALGWHRNNINHVHTLVVSTADAHLASCLARVQSKDIDKIQRATGESIDFAAARIHRDDDPIAPGTNQLSVLMLSPLAIRQRGSKQLYSNIRELDLSAAINARLSRLTKRTVKLDVQADALYVRANPDHSLLVPVKRFANGKRAYVIGMNVPLVIGGSEEDLCLAWYAGIGEKNRNGFGCIGLSDEGVGR
jgi:CRISPR-associated endoribonuclease Cas6